MNTYFHPSQLITLHNKGNSIVYKFRSTENGKDYILKVLPEDHPPIKQIVQFNLEYELTKDLNIDGVRKAFEQLKYKDRYALILDYFEGEVLNQSKSHKWDVIDFLSIAVKLADTIGKIHLKHIIHRDINPNNILWNRETKEVKIIDFGLSTKISRETQQVYNPGKLDGTLSYISPEQTGRMNRSIDYRTDLYSLGVVFYEMLTGKRPFESDDPMELVHYHIALTPPFDDLPKPLDKIVEKLLSKNAEDRYQSAFGLKEDLEACFSLVNTPEATHFIPGQKDYSQFFNIPQKLYGRENEIKQLMEEFDLVKSGSSRLLLIGGYSGVGKSSLVQEVQKPITAQKGYFVSGKFDQFQRNIPYFPFIRAFDLLISQLLTESQASLEGWKRKIIDAVGINGQLLVEILPNLELIIGPQEALSPLPPAEAQNRFDLTLLNFIKVFAQASSPIAIFIDDLHWSDPASLRLMEVLLLDENINHLLLIAAYRDNEVNESHPMIIWLNELKKQIDKISYIFLTPLSLNEVNELVANTLSLPVPFCRNLATLIFDKTDGNPFFVNQFFKNLYDNQLVWFDFEGNNWKWDENEIKALNITDNVVDLMSQKILKLPENTRNILKLAACIGNQFDLKTLASISNQSPIEVCNQLINSMSEGLTPALDDNYKYFLFEETSALENAKNVCFQFLHDRIQQAAYSLIPQEERQKVHLHIGRLLLKDLNDPEKDEGLFDIANHLNTSLDLVDDRDERKRYVELNLTAGIKAKSSTAHSSALSYFYNGIRCLEPDYWKTKQYQLAYQLYLNAAESEYLNGNHDQARNLLDDLLENSNSILERAHIYILRGNIAQTVGDVVLGLEEFSIALGQLGIIVPKEVTPEMIQAGIIRIETLRNGRPIPELVNLPEMQDQEKLLSILLILHSATPAFFVNKNLWVWLILEAIAILLEYGNTVIADVLYAPYGLFIGQALGDFESGYQWGMVGANLNKRFNNKAFRPKINVVFGNMVSHWRTHLKNNIPYSKEAYTMGIEYGDLIYAGISVFHLSFSQFLIGKPLKEVIDETSKYFEFLEKTKDVHIHCNRILVQLSHALQGNTNAPNQLDGNNYIEVASVEIYEKELNRIPLQIYYYAKLRLNYHTENFKQAYENGQKAMEWVEASLGMQIVPDQFLFHGLSILGYLPIAPQEEQEKLKEEAERIIAQMGKWAESAPMNFRHKYLLLLAEKERLDLNPDKPGNLLDEAIELAKENEFLQDEALANELAAKFWYSKGKDKFARVYLSDAIYLYSLWGATTKVEQLKESYPELIKKRELSSLTGSSQISVITSTSSGNANLLDLKSIIKASTAISEEVVLEKLLVKLLKIILENAGAQKCLLTRREENGEWYIQGEGIVDGPLKVLQWENVRESDKVPDELLQYVARTEESIVLHDAINHSKFGNSEYIKKNRPKSILCVPIYHQGDMQGIIYLENNLVSGAFTEERIELLQLLSGQIAVSIVNAVLYENLEFKVRERTATIEQQNAEIALEKQKSDDLLLNILPKSTAEELKEKGYAKPQSYDQVSVLFTDFVGFTTISEQLSPAQIIEELNDCFVVFDEIIDRNKLEKIKTIGDSYMCAGGVPVANRTNSIDAVRAGLEIQEFMKNWNAKRVEQGKMPWQLRLGIHTGKVVAGVVGQKKFAYDIWGDAVNIASRMEAGSIPGKVNISGETYNLVKDYFTCEYRGKVVAKNKGEIDMYFVNGIR